MSEIYSAVIGANDGFDQPAPINGLPGWTVYKETQTEIYKITHNLGAIMNVVATPMSNNTVLAVGAVTANSFIVSSWNASADAPKSSAFTFVAIKIGSPPNPPSPPTMK